MSDITTTNHKDVKTKSSSAQLQGLLKKTHCLGWWSNFTGLTEILVPSFAEPEIVGLSLDVVK